MSEKYNFNEKSEKDAEEHGMGDSGIFYRVENGNKNVCRVLTPFVAYASYFLGKGSRPAIAYGFDKGDPRSRDPEMKKSIRYVGYVLDQNDNKVKQAEFPYSVHKAIGALQENPDYAFDDIPMPYDIRITYNKEESPANMYNVQATPNRDEISPEILEDLEKKIAEYPPEKVVEKKKEQQIETDKKMGIWLTPEQVKKYKDDLEEELKKGGGNVEGAIDYPSEKINPEDIPF